MSEHNNPFKGKSVAQDFKKSKLTGQKFNNKKLNLKKRNDFRRKNSLLNTKGKFDPEKAIEDGTPWSQFKDELDNNGKQNADNDNQQEKEELEKLRQQNQRKFQMQEKIKEKTNWERFSPEPEPSNTESTKNKIDATIRLTQRLAQNEKRFAKNVVLTKQENNYMKKVITKTSILARNVNLKRTINDMKIKGVVNFAREK